MKKIITTMFLSVILIIATIGFTSASGNVPYEEQKTETQLEEEMRIYGGRTKAEFEARGENIAKSAEGVYNEFFDKYTEDQYGGIWFDDEGYLNIYLLEESKALEAKSLKTKAKIAEQKSMVSKNENVKVHYGKYSLVELQDANEEISNFLDCNKDLLLGGCILGVGEDINRVDIKLSIAFRDSDNEEIIKLRKHLEEMDVVAITYSQDMDEMPTYEESLHADYNVWLGTPAQTTQSAFSLAYATLD